MTDSEVKIELSSDASNENDELFKLYESDDKLEKIVLNRSVERQIEYIMLSRGLCVSCEIHNPYGSNILSMDQYHLILRHKRTIQLYQFQECTLELFHRFFGMTTTEFFDSISLDV
jgi:hypothetical protein